MRMKPEKSLSRKLTETKTISDSTEQLSSNDYLDDLEKDLDDLF